LLQSGAYDFKLGMLLLDRSFYIPMPHRLHHSRQVPGAAEDARAAIVSPETPTIGLTLECHSIL